MVEEILIQISRILLAIEIAAKFPGETECTVLLTRLMLQLVVWTSRGSEDDARAQMGKPCR